MIDPAQIPDEVVEAAAKAVADQLGDDWDDNVHTFCGDDWQLTPDGAKEVCRSIARAAIAAALNSWPALEVCYFLPQGRTITLPFPNVSKYPRKEGDA
jgi:hypothetical protein